MDYVEKLKQKSAAVRAHAKAYPDGASKIILTHRADIWEDKAPQFQKLRE